MARAPGDDPADQDEVRRSIEKLVDHYNNGICTSDEICEMAWRSLARLPAEARLAGLGPLVALGYDTVGAVGHTILTLCRNEELSRDRDFVQRFSPFGPGTRVEVSGGLDEFQSGGFGARGRSAVFLRFARASAGQIPVALIEFDEVIAGSAGSGRYGALIGSFNPDCPAWVTPRNDEHTTVSTVVAVHVMTTLPEDHELADAFFPWQVARARLTVISGERRVERWDTRVKPFSEGLTPHAVLHAALDSAKGRTWWHAVMRLGEIGDPDAIGRLGRLLRDSTKSDSERVQAADALSRSRSNDDAVADAIASVLDEREAQAVRQAAGKALARVLEPVKSLETWLDSEGLDELTRKLRQIWAGLPATRDLLPRTLAALDESAIDDSGAGAWELSLDKPDAKFWAAAHLARKGNHAALKHVCFVLRDQESDERKRLKAAETLGRMEDCGYFAVWPLLWQAGEQKECTPSVREAAAKALERFFAVDGTLPDFLEVELGDYLPAWEDLVAVLIAGLPATRSVLVKTLQILDGGEENPELWQWKRLRENAEVVLRRSLHIDLVSILTNRLRSRSRPFFLVAKPRH